MAAGEIGADEAVTALETAHSQDGNEGAADGRCRPGQRSRQKGSRRRQGESPLLPRPHSGMGYADPCRGAARTPRAQGPRATDESNPDRLRPAPDGTAFASGPCQVRPRGHSAIGGSSRRGVGSQREEARGR